MGMGQVNGREQGTDVLSTAKDVCKGLKETHYFSVTNAWVDNAICRKRRLLNENLSASMKYLFITRRLDWTSRKVWKTPDVSKAIQAIAIILVCPPKLGGKFPLLKTAHTLIVGCREVHLYVA